MELDLGKALDDAARSGTAGRPDLAVGPVLQRIRRRRVVRHTVEGTVGVAAVGAVAVGALQVTEMRGDRMDPVPPATAEPTPAPSPTPTPSATPVTWAAVTAGGEFVCGLPVPGVDDPAGDADLRFEVVLQPAEAEPATGVSPADAGALTLEIGEPIAVDPVLVNGTDQRLDAVATDPVDIWFIADGTVVGQLAASGPGSAEYTGAAGARFSVERLAGNPVACTPDGVGTEPLPPGEYAIYVVQGVQLSDDVTALVTGAPTSLVISEPQAPPEPVFDPHPDLEELVISPGGLGPLAVGVPPATNPGAAMIERDPDACNDFDPANPARWVPSGYPPVERDGEPRPAFHVAADDTMVGRIDVLNAPIRTAEGVGIGTPLPELRATYPALEGPFDGPVSRVWWLTGPSGTLVFETQDDALGLQPAGTPESVILMRVLAGGFDPRFATANTDDVAGGCL